MTLVYEYFHHRQFQLLSAANKRTLLLSCSYMAPEYAQSGQITEKADVYSFGVVLVELVTGRKAVDINRPKGQQFLTEWVSCIFDPHFSLGKPIFWMAKSLHILLHSKDP